MESTLSRFQRWTKRLLGAGTARKRTEITTQTDRILIIRRRSVVRAWCDECAREVEMVSLRDIVNLGDASEATPDAQTLGCHFCEGPDGTLLACLDSLTKS